MHLQVSRRFGWGPPTSPPENLRGDRSIRPISVLRFWISEGLTQFTVPQKGHAKRGSNRQITNKSPTHHLEVTLKSLKSNIFLEPLLAYPFCGTVISHMIHDKQGRRRSVTFPIINFRWINPKP